MNADKRKKPRRFLAADWRYLAMLNYEVAPEVVRSFIPPGVEVDFFEGKTFVSVVGFLFHRTRVLGLPIPFHVNFEEINLRYYVKREAGGETRRGVGFVKEVVPRRAIAMVANRVFNENYVALPTRHTVEVEGDAKLARYEWKVDGRWQSVEVRACGEARPLAPGSEEEFIAEHYWGYAADGRGGTFEYEVLHPPWRVWRAESARLDIDAGKLYGDAFAETLAGEPHSAFLAEGSRVGVHMANRIAAE